MVVVNNSRNFKQFIELFRFVIFFCLFTRVFGFKGTEGAFITQVEEGQGEGAPSCAFGFNGTVKEEETQDKETLWFF